MGRLVAVLGCLGAALTAALLIGFGPGTVAGGLHRYLADGPHDDHLLATARLFSLRARDRTELPVVILGGSATRESISDPGELESRLRVATGLLTPRVYDLAAAGETLWEYGGMIEELGAPFDGILVLGINRVRLSRTRRSLERLIRRPRLGLTADSIDSQARRLDIEPPRRTGIYLIDNWLFFRRRLRPFVENLLRGPVQFRRHRYLERDPLPAANLAERAVRLRADYLQHYDANVTANLDRLAAAIALARQRGDPAIVLLETPHNEDFIRDHLGMDAYAHYQERMQRFARDHGLAYWTLDAAAGLRSADYHDHAHLRSAAAQRRYTETLASHLAPLVTERAAATPRTRASAGAP
jgi:hypothetical protein